MYDLDQDPFINERKPQKKSHLPIILGVVVFVLFFVAVCIIFVPKIKQAVIDSNVIELIAEAEAPQVVQRQSSRICFVVQNDGTTSFRTEEKQLDSAPTTAHAVLEALLDGPSKDSGLTTLIPKGTRLIGVTISDNYAFVDFSSKFTRDKNTTFLAIQQVNQTLKAAYPALEKIIILIEGKVYSN